jgi:hypothetical protein
VGVVARFDQEDLGVEADELRFGRLTLLRSRRTVLVLRGLLRVETCTRAEDEGAVSGEHLLRQALQLLGPGDQDRELLLPPEPADGSIREEG